MSVILLDVCCGVLSLSRLHPCNNCVHPQTISALACFPLLSPFSLEPGISDISIAFVCRYQFQFANSPSCFSCGIRKISFFEMPPLPEVEVVPKFEHLRKAHEKP